MSQAADLSYTYSVETLFPARVVSLNDPANAVELSGANPIVVISTVQTPFVVEQQIDQPAGRITRSISIDAAANQYVVFSVTGDAATGGPASSTYYIRRYRRGVKPIVQVGDEVTVSEASNASATSFASRRVLDTSTAYLVTSVTDPSNGDMINVYRTAALSVTSAAGSFRVRAGTLTSVSAADVQGSKVFVYGQSATSVWAIAVASLPITAASSWTVLTQATHPIALCQDTTCGAVERCIVDTVTAGRLLCFLTTTQLTLIGAVFVTNDDGASFLPYATVEAALVLLRNARIDITAMIIDSLSEVVFVAYNELDGPSTVIKIYRRTLALTGVFAMNKVGTDPEVIRGFRIRAETRELVARVQLTFAVKLVTFNLFGVRQVLPSIIDARGGATVTVAGEGFYPFLAPLCSFGDGANETVPATIVDNATILCVAPVTATKGSCATVNFNVGFGQNRTTTTSNAPLTRPASVTLLTLDNGVGGAYGSERNTTTITITGIGFVASPQATCQVVDALGRMAFRAAVTYVNSTRVLCVQPKGIPSTVPPAYLYHTHDGQVFSPSRLEYAIVGEAAGIASPTTAVTVKASAVTPVPAVEIHVVDLNGNSLYELDNPPYGNGPHVSQCDLQSDEANRATDVTNATALVRSTQKGVATFESIALSRPKVGIVTLVFTMVIGSSVAETFVQVIVEVGTPSQVAFFQPVIFDQWRFGVTGVLPLFPSPEMVIADAAGNAVRSPIDDLPPQMSVQWFNEVLDSELQSDSLGKAAANASSSGGGSSASGKTITLSDVSTAIGGDGVYRFPDINTRGMFGGQYALKFSVSGSFTIASLTTNAIALQRCLPGLQYARRGTHRCLRCPEFGFCDGTDRVLVDNGAWRPDEAAFTFYSCEPPYSNGHASCGNGTCLDGFAGPRCSVCANGYGKSGLDCQRCGTQLTNWLMISLIVVALFFLVLILVYTSIPATADNVVPMDDYDTQERKEDILPIVLKMLTNHLQISSRTGVSFDGASKLMGDMFRTQQSIGFLGSPNVVFLQCEIQTNYYYQYLGILAFPVVLIAIFLVVMIIISFVNRLIVRRRMALRAIFEPPVEQCESHRAAVLGEDESSDGGMGEAVDELRAYKMKQDEFDNLESMEASMSRSQRPSSRGSDRLAKSRRSNNSGIATASSLNGSGGKPNVSVLVDEGKLWRPLEVACATGLIVLFLPYPTVLEASANLLVCETIDYGDVIGTRRVLAVDRSISCDTAQYGSYQFLAYVVLAIYGIGIPFASVGMIRLLGKYYMNGNQQRAKTLFYFMTGGYHDHRWFWESVVMVRKALLLVLVVAITDASLRNLTVMWFVGVCLVINVVADPYSVKRLAYLELCSLSCVWISCNLARLFTVPWVARDASAIDAVSYVIIGINGLMMMMFLIFLLMGIRNKLAILYYSDPGTFWMLDCLFRVERTTREAMLAKEREEILQLEDELVMWKKLSSESEETLVYSEVLFVLSLLKKYYYHHPRYCAEVQPQVDSFESFIGFVHRKIDGGEFDASDLEAVGVEEVRLCNLLRRCFSEDKAIMARKRAHVAQQAAEEAERTKADGRLRAHQEQLDSFAKPFAHLRDTSRLVGSVKPLKSVASPRAGDAAMTVLRRNRPAGDDDADDAEGIHIQLVAPSATAGGVDTHNRTTSREASSDGGRGDKKATTHEVGSKTAIATPQDERPMERVPQPPPLAPVPIPPPAPPAAPASAAPLSTGTNAQRQKAKMDLFWGGAKAAV